MIPAPDPVGVSTPKSRVPFPTSTNMISYIAATYNSSKLEAVVPNTTPFLSSRPRKGTKATPATVQSTVSNGHEKRTIFGSTTSNTIAVAPALNPFNTMSASVKEKSATNPFSCTNTSASGSSCTNENVDMMPSITSTAINPTMNPFTGFINPYILKVKRASNIFDIVTPANALAAFSGIITPPPTTISKDVNTVTHSESNATVNPFKKPTPVDSIFYNVNYEDVKAAFSTSSTIKTSPSDNTVTSSPPPVTTPSTTVAMASDEVPKVSSAVAGENVAAPHSSRADTTTPRASSSAGSSTSDEAANVVSTGTVDHNAVSTRDTPLLCVNLPPLREPFGGAAVVDVMGKPRVVVIGANNDLIQLSFGREGEVSEVNDEVVKVYPNDSAESKRKQADNQICVCSVGCGSMMAVVSRVGDDDEFSPTSVSLHCANSNLPLGKPVRIHEFEDPRAVASPSGTHLAVWSMHDDEVDTIVECFRVEGHTLTLIWRKKGVHSPTFLSETVLVVLPLREKAITSWDLRGSLNAPLWTIKPHDVGVGRFQFITGCVLEQRGVCVLCAVSPVNGEVHVWEGDCDTHRAPTYTGKYSTTGRDILPYNTCAFLAYPRSDNIVEISLENDVASLDFSTPGVRRVVHNKSTTIVSFIALHTNSRIIYRIGQHNRNEMTDEVSGTAQYILDCVGDRSSLSTPIQTN